jgi:hypothetical protein
VVVAELDLVLREDHPVRGLAAELRRLELQPAREHRAGERNRDGRACAEVPRAADDLPRRPLPHVDLAELQPVGVRVLPGFEDAADAEEAEVAVLVRHPAALDPLDLGRGDAEPLRQLGQGHVDGDVVAEPRNRDAHQNCLRIRRSGDQRGRISSMS